MHPRTGTLTYKQQLDLIKNFPAPQSPKGYKDFKGFFLQAILASFQGDDPETNRVMPYYNAILVHMLQSNTPTYYLTDEITEAAENTKIPSVESDEVPFRFLNIFTSDGITAVVKIQSMSDMHGLTQERYRWDDSAKKARILFNALDAQVTFSCVIFAKDNEVDGFRQLLLDLVPPSGENKDTLCATPHSFGYAGDYAEKDQYTRRSLKEIAQLIVNAVLLIKHQPSLITVEKSATSALGFSSKPSNEPMPVRWLGKTFSNDRTRSRSTGGHASPRSHWRRGHWHGYRCGEGRKVLKRKWIQPVYVNPQ